MQVINPQDDKRRMDLRQIAVNCWGTSEIFKIRADRYERSLRKSALVGFALPIVVGVLVIALGPDWKYLRYALVLVALISAAQALYNAYLIFHGYERELRDCLDSASTNRSIATRADLLSQNVQILEDEFARQYHQLVGENRNQETQDERRKITNKERRMAGRFGLFQFRQRCDACKKTPTSTDAKADGSNCKFCGDF